MLTCYHSEMGEKRPEDTQVEARLAHYGKHYYLKTAPGIVLAGRGVEFLGVLTADRLVPGSKFAGWGEYKVTLKAFEQIKQQYRVSMEMLL
jgi:hypothetical protein